MELEYNPCLEIDPSKFVIVIGPNFTNTVLDEVTNRDEPFDPTRLALTSRNLVDIGIQVLLEADSFQSDAEKAKCDTLYKNAYELDPLFAVRKLSSSLQKCGKYDAWLRRSFEVDLGTSNKDSPSLLKITQLQKRGALLVYTHYDDVLCRVSKTQPILLNNVPGFESWSKGESEGFLHLHGGYWEPTTVTFDCDVYDTPNHPLKVTTERLSEMFRKRHVVMLGFDSNKHDEDPLLTKFTEKYVAEIPLNLHTFHLTRADNPSDLNCVHRIDLSASHKQQVPYLHSLGTMSLSLWSQIEFPLEHSVDNQMISLIVGGKQGAKEISKMMSSTPGVNFALVNSVSYSDHFVYTVSVRVDISKQKAMWMWVVQEMRDQLLSKGLLAVVMQSGTFLWMRGKPETKASAISSELATPITNQPSISVPSVHRTFDNISSFKPKEETIPLPPFSSPELNFCGKKVPRYTMHQVRARHSGHPYAMTSSGSVSAKHQRPSHPDLPTFGGQHNPRTLFERRASLPVNSINSQRNSAQTLAQLAHNLRAFGPTNTHDPPSYVAIKQALLCDWYKRRRSIQTDPKTLKYLLKSKLVSESPDLLKLRRYSDPGSYLHQPDSFARRKELFIDENRTWAHSYGQVIERRIAKWQARQKERRRQEMLAWQNGEYPPGAQGLKYHLLNPLQTNGVPTTLPSANGRQVFPGLNSYVYPAQTIMTTVSNGLTNTAAPSMLYSPFITPYTFVNPYQPIVQVGQPTTFYLPQNNVPSQQKVVYLVPPATTTTTLPSTLAPSLTSHDHTNLIPHPTHNTRKTSDSNMIEDECLRDRFKRRQSVPNNLSSLLVSPLEIHDPGSPPPTKRIRLTPSPHTHTTHTIHTHSPQAPSSPEQQVGLSSMQHHLLQVHRTNLSHNRFNENGSNSASHSPLHSPRSVGQSSICSPTHQHSRNNFGSDSSLSDIDEREAERIVGGAVLSPDQQTEYGVPAPHSQLQLWQFLLELLLISANTHLIQWSNNDFEFQINKPTDVAKLWGKVTNNESMDYQKLARGLRYYFSKGIMSEVKGQKLSFKYNGSIQNYIEMRRSSIADQEDIVVVE